MKYKITVVKELPKTVNYLGLTFLKRLEYCMEKNYYVAISYKNYNKVKGRVIKIDYNEFLVTIFISDWVFCQIKISSITRLMYKDFKNKNSLKGWKNKIE